MSAFTAAELRVLRYVCTVAAQVIPPNHPSRTQAQSIAARVDAELDAELTVSLERNETDCAAPELNRDEYVGSAEAARLLGCSQRRVQQRAAAGELPAVLVGRSYAIKIGNREWQKN